MSYIQRPIWVKNKTWQSTYYKKAHQSYLDNQILHCKVSKMEYKFHLHIDALKILKNIKSKIFHHVIIFKIKKQYRLNNNLLHQTYLDIEVLHHISYFQECKDQIHNSIHKQAQLNSEYVLLCNRGCSKIWIAKISEGVSRWTTSCQFW